MTDKITVKFVLMSMRRIGVPPCGTNEFEDKELQRKCIVYDVLLKALEETRSDILSTCKSLDPEAFIEHERIRNKCSQ